MLVHLAKKSMENLGFLGKISCQDLDKKSKMIQDLGKTSKMSKIFQDLGKTNKSPITGKIYTDRQKFAQEHKLQKKINNFDKTDTKR